MRKQFEYLKDALVIHLDGEIDQYVATEIKAKIDIEIEASNKKKVIIDLDGVTLMDSSGIGLIVGRYKNAHALGRCFAISGGTESVRKIIELSGILKVVPMYKHVIEADKELNKIIKCERIENNE